MATRAEIEQALAFYEKSGNADAARKLKATLGALPAETDGTSYTTPQAQAKPDGLLAAGAKEVAGAVETAGTLATGAIAAPVAGFGAGIYATAKQILNGEFGTEEASRAVEQAAEGAASAVTYQPRTDAGQRNVAAVGNAIAPYERELQALTPLIGEAGIGQAVRSAAQGTRAAAEATGIPAAVARTAGRATDAVGDAAAQARAALTRETPPPAAGDRSVGAAEVPAADVRRAAAAELGFKDEARLTKGQATQEPVEIGFEREQAKSLVRGPEIRQRYENQARVAEGVFDDFVDQTGGAVPDFSGGGKVALGGRIEAALKEGAAQQKNKVNVAYKKAEAAEGALPTNGATVATYLEENAAARGTAPILKAAAAEAKRLKIADKATGLDTNVKNLYELRKFVSQNAGQDGASAFHAGQLKKVIDERIAADGGPLYKQATEAHARFRAQYKDASLIKGILENKPGSPDRIIASDQILNRVLADSTSVDEIKHMRRLMQTHGAEAGQAAWKDLQAGGIEYLRDITYKRAKAGPNGTLRPNATQLNNAVNKLDQAGKLDALYGTQGAEKIRLLRDVVREIENETGANYTNNANPIIEFLESIPVAGKSVTASRNLYNATNSMVRDRKLRARLKENLK